MASHSPSHFQSASADGQHGKRPGCAGVTVGSQQHLPRNPKPFHVNRVTHTITRTTEPYAELLTGAAEEEMVIGVLEVGLQQVVIHVLNG
jgi:hypothetical protein